MSSIFTVAERNIPRMTDFKIFSPQAFGELIKSHGLTTRDLAQATSIPEELLESYIEGRSVPSLDIVVALADYLGTSCDAVIGRNADNYSMLKPAEEDGDAISEVVLSGDASLSTSDLLGLVRYTMSIRDMGLSTQAYNCLKRTWWGSNIVPECSTLRDVMNILEGGMFYKAHNAGRKIVQEVVSRVLELTGVDYTEQNRSYL